MGNSVSYSFQQEPLGGVVVANDNHAVNQPQNNSANQSDNLNGNNSNVNAANSVAINNPQNVRPAGNLIISLAPRRGVLDGDLFGTIRSDLASYFPFGRFAPPPPIHQATTIRSLVNLHKDSVVLVREEGDQYKLLFKFDALAPCSIRVYFNATETTDDIKSSLQGRLEIGPIQAEKGIGQMFTHPSDSMLDLGSSTETLTFNPSTQQYPLVIEISCDNEPLDDTIHKQDTTNKADTGTILNQTTYCTLLACGDGSFALKVMIQKIFHRGQTYVVHDIFGLDHTGERESEGSRECVVCMSEPRDTTVLPCRHLCVCAPCADLMRVQTNKCPICRAPVTSLLNITVSKAHTHAAHQTSTTPSPSSNLPPSSTPSPPLKVQIPEASVPSDGPSSAKALLDDEEDDEHLLVNRDKDKKFHVIEK